MARSLRDELGKSVDFELREQEAYLQLARTRAELEAGMSRVLKPAGLSESTYNALRILRGAGPKGARCSDIGRMMVVRVPDVTRLVDRLVEMELATRARDADDRRAVRVRISEEGLALLARLDDLILNGHRDQLTGMSQDELETLCTLLEKARECARSSKTNAGLCEAAEAEFSGHANGNGGTSA